MLQLRLHENALVFGQSEVSNFPRILLIMVNVCDI